MFQVLIGRETLKLIELVLQIGAKTGGVSPFARMRSLAIADKIGDIADNRESKLFPEIVGEPGDAGGVRDILRPVKWVNEYSQPCEWVLSVLDDQENILQTIRAGSVWDLFKKTTGVLPVGFLEWAAVSHPGDKILSFDNRENKYYQLEVIPG